MDYQKQEMIFWAIYFPGLVVAATLYFMYLPALHKRATKTTYKIDQETDVIVASREYALALVSLLLFALNGLFLGFAIDEGYTPTVAPTAFSIQSIASGVLSFILAAILYDFYFYITHRLLHWRPVFKHVHHLHHRSHDTNPWSAFSFHPLEGLLHVAGITIVAMIVPMSKMVLAIFAAYLVLISVYGHSGYELRSHRLKIFGFFNTSYHHFLHHRFANCNYGIYFNIWDFVFRTNHKDYNRMLDQLSNRIAQGERSSGMPDHKPGGEVL